MATDIIKNEVESFNTAFKNDAISHVYALKTDEFNHGLLILGSRFHAEEQEDFDNELLAVIARNISSAINTCKLLETLKNSNIELDKRISELENSK